MAECVICFHEYSSVIPRLLECGHTFCEWCLKALAESRNGRVECPNCQPHGKRTTVSYFIATAGREVHVLQAGQDYTSLKRNFALEELLAVTGPHVES